jgi:hypothetical protein
LQRDVPPQADAANPVNDANAGVDARPDDWNTPAS